MEGREMKTEEKSRHRNTGRGRRESSPFSSSPPVRNREARSLPWNFSRSRNILCFFSLLWIMQCRPALRSEVLHFSENRNSEGYHLYQATAAGTLSPGETTLYKVTLKRKPEAGSFRMTLLLEGSTEMRFRLHLPGLVGSRTLPCKSWIDRPGSGVCRLYLTELDSSHFSIQVENSSSPLPNQEAETNKHEKQIPGEAIPGERSFRLFAGLQSKGALL